MKRLIIEGDWIESVASPGYWYLKASNGSLIATCGTGVKVTVEDIPDPLPTEPGTVIDAYIYGRRNRLVRLDESTGMGPWRATLPDGYLASIYYGDDEIEQWDLVVAAPEWHKGLVRLPDPEATS